MKLLMFTRDYKEKAQTTKSHDLVVWAFGVVRKFDSFWQPPSETSVNTAISKHVSDSGGTRTPNQQNRNLPFYPIELRSQRCKSTNFIFPDKEAEA